jgi:hypothetical protein
MHRSRMDKSRSVTVNWSLAHMLLGALTGAAVTSFVIALPMYGVALGLVQWAVVRSFGTPAWRWPAATAAGGILGSVAVLAFVLFVRYEESWRLVIAAFALVGLSIGAAQAITLLPNYLTARRWWLVSLAGTAAHVTAAAAVGVIGRLWLSADLVGANAHPQTLDVLAMVGGALGGLAYAAVTLPVVHQLTTWGDR